MARIREIYLDDAIARDLALMATEAQVAVPVQAAECVRRDVARWRRRQARRPVRSIQNGEPTTDAA